MKIFTINSPVKEGKLIFRHAETIVVNPRLGNGFSGNWFVKYAIAQEILREAGWKENIVTGMLAAILMVFSGSTISAASRKNNVSEEDLLRAMQDKPTVEKVYQIYNEEKREIQKPKEPTKPSMNITFTDIIQSILRHESLIPGQTPFRITNPSMKNWNKIHGFQIDKNPNAPSNRQNFLFLKNPNEVPMAVKKQFENYAYNPQKYGLPINPTLEDALRLFDQSGVGGKMNFLKKQFPHIDFKTPLSALVIS